MTSLNASIRHRRSNARPLRPYGRSGSIALLVVSAILGQCIFGLATRAEAAAPPSGAFSLDDVVKTAKEMAQKPYQKPEAIPPYLSSLDYNQWREIRFQSSQSPWPSSDNFNIQFYHLGYIYKDPVRVNLVASGRVHRFSFSPKMFNYAGKDFASKVPDQLGFAGFSLTYPLNSAQGRDEVLAFLGASYFRAVGKNQVFGLSARGISIDTASPSGEQFPYFKEFWLVKPEEKAKRMTLYALLDGESVTGAYRFVVDPGEQTTTEIEAVLFLRKKVQKFGVAPFSSMFLQGSNSIRRFNTVYPQVHDSDGLSIHQTGGGEWIWRPLQNPKRLAVSSFLVNDLHGFGLMQRDRRFCTYESLALGYQKRPSVWVTPKGQWGKGQVQLIEIPTNTNNNDNIVAFWVPDKLPEPQNPIRYAYEIAWQGDHMTLPPSSAYAVNTLRGKGNIQPDAEEFNIDFKGETLASLFSKSEVSAQISVENGGKLLEHHMVKNPYIGGVRLEFQIKPTGNPIQLRVHLQKGNQALTETWDYVANPE